MAEQSRRNHLRLAQRQPTTHAGLWLDKFQTNQLLSGESVPANKQPPAAQLVGEVAAIGLHESYERFFCRWQDALAQIGAVCKQAKTLGRLSIGLGAEGVLETAITLHHTYGVPYIPGSALKGLAASYARRRLTKETWGKGTSAYKTLFGDTDSAGYITFFDALYVPGTGYEKRPLWPDVITVHHPDYYQGDQAPADWDNPTPIPFLSATGDYLLALTGDPQWVGVAYKILAYALSEEGIGAKTSSGYGRMTLDGFKIEGGTVPVSSTAATPSPLDPDQGVVESFLLRLKGMSNASLAGEIQAIYQQWRGLAVADTNRKLLAQAILKKIDEAGRTKKSADQAWYQELKATANQTE
jgi:CRISPR-associated protein Cmr6